MMSTQWSQGVVGGLAVACLLVAQAVGCEANPEFTCLGSEGPCPLGQGGEGGQAAEDCLASCDTTKASGQTGEYPCEVDKVIDNCRRCHVEALLAESGAPFSLDTYEDSQQVVFDIAVWARMKPVIESDFMPAAAPKLSDAEKNTVIQDWICQCAPPRPADEVCD